MESRGPYVRGNDLRRSIIWTDVDTRTITNQPTEIVETIVFPSSGDCVSLEG